MSEKGKKNKKKTGLGLAIWILLFLIILIVFLVKQEEIKENFDKSGATALIEKKTGKNIFDDKKGSSKKNESDEIIIDLTKKSTKTEPIAKSEAKNSEKTEKTEVQKSEEKKSEVTLKQTEKSAQAVQQSTQTQANSTQPKNTQTQAQITQKSQTNTQAQSTQKTQNATETKTNAQSTTTVISSATQTPAVSNMTKTKICFVAIDSDGAVARKEVSRSVAKDSPLSEALNELLKGPSSTEAKTGCQTYIPAGSKLIGISISDGIATLNFNEEFQFNPNGPMGANVQLMQIVYTATSFLTVKKVQFLIEGQKRDYLTEGVWIGSPLNRNSF